MSLKMFSRPRVRYGAIAVLALATILAAYADKQNAEDFSSSSIDELALMQYLGTVHASFDICKIGDTPLKQRAEEVMATARFIAVARYKQLGRSAVSAANDEQQSYNAYQADHKQIPSLPACKLYQRQIDALVWRASEVGVQYIHDNEKLHTKEN